MESLRTRNESKNEILCLGTSERGAVVCVFSERERKSVCVCVCVQERERKKTSEETHLIYYYR